MDISEKKIEEIAIEMQKLGLINTGPTAFKRMLEAINITGKDGLLDVLLEAKDLFGLGQNAKEEETALWPTSEEKAEKILAKIEAHLSQWRQK